MKFPLFKNYNIANLATSLRISLGFLGIVLVFNQYSRLGLSLAFLGMGLDKLDGMLARKFGLESKFGEQLDNVADLFNACVVPAIIIYLFGLDSWLMVSLLILFIVLGSWCSVVVILNGAYKDENGEYYIGFPLIFISLCLISALSFYPLISRELLAAIMYVLFPFLLLLMISPLRYYKNGALTKLITVLSSVLIMAMWWY